MTGLAFYAIANYCKIIFKYKFNFWYISLQTCSSCVASGTLGEIYIPETDHKQNITKWKKKQQKNILLEVHYRHFEAPIHIQRQSGHLFWWRSANPDHWSALIGCNAKQLGTRKFDGYWLTRIAPYLIETHLNPKPT